MSIEHGYHLLTDDAKSVSARIFAAERGTLRHANYECSSCGNTPVSRLATSWSVIECLLNAAFGLGSMIVTEILLNFRPTVV
jgi:ribosomal protein L37AE/L43A